MAIQIGGVVSGIDTDSVIQQLLEVDNRIKKKLEDKKTGVQSVKDLYGELNTQLLNVKSEADNLLLSSTFQKRSAATTDSTVLGVSASDGATAGTYVIQIDNLATNSVRQSTAQINSRKSRTTTGEMVGGSSTVTLTNPFATAGFDTAPDGNTRVVITTDAATYTSSALNTYATVQAFMDEVNAHAADVTLSYDTTTDKFTLRRDTAAGTLQIEDDDNGGAGVTPGFFSTAGMFRTGDAFNTTITVNESEQGVTVGGALSDTSASNVETALAANGTLTLNGVSISYATTDTLTTIISKINNVSGSTGVSGFYDSTLDKVVLRAVTEGPKSIAMSETGGNLITVLKLGTNATTVKGEQAKFYINGSATTDLIKSDTNTYIFNGITINLKKDGDNDEAAPGDAGDASATITVTQDVESVSTSIKNFVTAYNDYAQFVADNASYDPVTASGGKLFGDSLLYSIDARFKRMLFQPQAELVDTHELLAQLGITLGALNTADANKLVVDDAKLANAIATNVTAVEALFGRKNAGSATKTRGIADELSDYLKELTKFQGILDIRENGLDSQIRDIDDQIEREDDRLLRVEESLRRQFNAMEIALAKLNSEGATIAQRLSNL